MPENIEYIKAGDILIAPRLDYKHQFLLKCLECDECYCLLGPFLAHCASHYAREAMEEVHQDVEIQSDLNELNYASNEIQEDLHDTFIFSSDMASELAKLDEEIVEPYAQKEIAEEEIITIKEEIDEDILTKQGLANDLEQTLLSLDTEEIDDDDDFMEGGPGWENDDSADEFADTTSGNSEFLKMFLAERENVLALVDAYKSEPELWNKNLPTQMRSSSLRNKCLCRITEVLAEKINLDISIKQVATAILHLRRIYRAKLERERIGNIYDERQDDWLSDSLCFLKPFLENTPIAVIDSHPEDLTPAQIERLICIYKGYSHLWNTDLVEYCCKNKRADALKQMVKTIENEMDLEVNEKALQKYLHCLHVHFSREKRREMGLTKSKEPRSEYYDHMLFLYHHEGPFKCSTCKRQFKSPLQLKAHKYEHSGNYSLKCHVCKKGFTKVDPYVSHVRRHMNDLSMECKECGKRFLRGADLLIHMRHHTGVKPFCCDVCGASFRHSQAFNVHKRRHSKQYSHKCSVCSKGCYTKHELDVHMKSHIDTRDCACPVCGKKFKTKKTVHQHMFIHEEGRKHVCTLCGKAFKNKIGLGHHLKTHNKNKADATDYVSIFDSKT